MFVAGVFRRGRARFPSAEAECDLRGYDRRTERQPPASDAPSPDLQRGGAGGEDKNKEKTSPGKCNLTCDV